MGNKVFQSMNGTQLLLDITVPHTTPKTLRNNLIVQNKAISKTTFYENPYRGLESLTNSQLD
jgi:hypothetical protein